MAGSGSYRKYRAVNAVFSNGVGGTFTDPPGLDIGLSGLSPGFLIAGIAVDNFTNSWLKLSTEQWVPPYTTGWSSPVFPNAQQVTGILTNGPNNANGTVVTIQATDIAPTIWVFQDTVLYNSGYAVNPSSALATGYSAPSGVPSWLYILRGNSNTLWDAVRDGNTNGTPATGHPGVIGYMLNSAGTQFDHLREPVGNDGATAANILAVALSGFNGTTYDRLRSLPNAAGAWGPVLLTRPIGAQTTGIAAGTGTANNALTLTIPAPAAGLRNVIHHIRLGRVATAALAGTAALQISTTNLNSIRWDVGNAMAAGGTQIDVDEDFPTGLPSATTAVATTIVMPAPGAAVLWTGWVAYRVDAF